jgi:hypothetical protein
MAVSAIFDSCGLYIQSKTTLRDQIAAMDQIILALNLAILRAAGGEDVTEYQLNDGQTIIKQVNRGVAGMTKSLMEIEALRNYYINKYNGRVFRLVDSKNFSSNGPW